MALRVCLAGVTGWAGSELARAVATAPDLSLVSGVSRTHAGREIGDVLDLRGVTAPIAGSAAEALETPCDVFVEFTRPEVAKANVMMALQNKAHVVVGTSGLSDDDFDEIGEAARASRLGVLACGNFALTAVLLERFAELAAQHVPNWEIVEYASETKTDVPSGTVRELTQRLSSHGPGVTVAPDQTLGPRETRGAVVDGTQVHCLRLPGHVLAVDVVFGMPDQTLTLRHSAGGSAVPYVEGALLAIRRVGSLVGLHRGLDQVLRI